MDFFNVSADEVVGGYVVAGCVNYAFALKHFLPLIARLDIQRDPLKTKFYSRLESDINRGCIMPPITIALVSNQENWESSDAITDYIETNIDSAFILDGIQRLNTLQRSSKHLYFDSNTTLFVNYIIASSRDKLLYRMITLNNGQKAMSARHQIDVLAETFFDFSDIGLKLIPEKGNARVRAPHEFKKVDFVKGYIAYLSGSVNIDNQKIIEEKMDELIANKIIESDIVIRETEFTDVVQLINSLSRDEYLKNWIRVLNNFIGLCAGIKQSYKFMSTLDNAVISSTIIRFEKAFSSINVSKVNIGKVRRECVSQLVESFDKTLDLEEYDFLDKISGWIS